MIKLYFNPHPKSFYRLKFLQNQFHILFISGTCWVLLKFLLILFLLFIKNISDLNLKKILGFHYLPTRQCNKLFIKTKNNA